MERVCVALEPGCRSGSSLYIYRVYLLTFTYLLTLTYVDTVKTRGLPRDGAEPGPGPLRRPGGCIHDLLCLRKIRLSLECI